MWVTSEDNNSPIVEYIVYYTESSADDPDELFEAARMPTTRELSPGSRLETLVRTNPWVEYTFYVVARNAIGMSDKASHDDDGNPAICFTEQTAPKSNPQDVCVRLGRPNQLVIIWKVSHVVSQ